MSLLTKLQG